MHAARPPVPRCSRVAAVNISHLAASAAEPDALIVSLGLAHVPGRELALHGWEHFR